MELTTTTLLYNKHSQPVQSKDIKDMTDCPVCDWHRFAHTLKDPFLN